MNESRTPDERGEERRKRDPAVAEYPGGERRMPQVCLPARHSGQRASAIMSSDLSQILTSHIALTVRFNGAIAMDVLAKTLFLNLFCFDCHYLKSESM